MNEIIIRPRKQKKYKVKLYIKNMVCGRCEMALTSELEKWASILLFNLGKWKSQLI
jgi:NMD protein affecting ribosome stability and mRNA decay